MKIEAYHSFLPDDGHPVLHPVHSVGDLGEVVFAEGLLAHGEGAVVRPRHAEVITVTIELKNMCKSQRQGMKMQNLRMFSPFSHLLNILEITLAVK